ncbi:MAG: bifunctional nuclease family protein [Desulfotomaculaceae bacterium]|nr:bifunctional nuclease family protein [Desulfotomaculaceae bacterium]
MIPVKVKELVCDLMMNPVVLLIDEDEEKALPIWVGPFEAQSISLALQGICPERPLTHDLLMGICERLETRLIMVIISDVIDGNYLAELHLWRRNKEIVIDARPSDAIALAVRAQAPIYLSDKVAQDSLAIDDLLNEEQQQEFRKILESGRSGATKKVVH